MSGIYPWLEPAWQRLQSMIRANRLPHGLLIAGPTGTGKQALARLLAHAILCQSPRDDGYACGSCRACELIAAGSHPDLLLVSPLDDSSVIRIEQVRELIQQLALTASQSGGRRVAVLRPAEAMNRNAANSLLKTLEEPPLNTTLVLVSDAPASLPATIRSRCQRLPLTAPIESCTAWLAPRLGDGPSPEVALRLAGGGPLLAASLAEEGVFRARAEVLKELGQLAAGQGDPLSIAARWASQPWQATLRVLSSLVHDLALARSPQTRELVRNTDLGTTLRTVAERLDFRKLLNARQLVDEYWRLLGTGGSLRPQDALEDIAIRWAEG